MSDDLKTWIADLAHAAAGGARIASSAVATARFEATTGVAVDRLPGPVLQQALARRTGAAAARGGTVPATAVPGIAARMAANTANQAAQLLAGTP